MAKPLSVSQYDLNDYIRITATFIGTNGISPVTPSMMFFLVKNPLGTVASYQYGVAAASIQALASNVFAKDLSLDLAGQWYYRAQSTGIGQGAEEWTFFVASSQIV